MKILIFLMITFAAVTAGAMTVDSINFEDKVTVAGKELVINGVGIRKATFLKIKVYYGALYLVQKATNSAAFLGTADPKQITMHFVRDVDAKDLKKTYKEAFEGANKETYKSMLSTFDTFNSNLTDIKKGDTMTFQFLPDGVILMTASKPTPKIGDAAFSKALLNMWFINPLDEGLTKGLLTP